MGAESPKNLIRLARLSGLGAAVVALALAQGVTRLPAAERPQGAGSDLVELLLGGARQAVGGMLYARADVYFHGGVELSAEGTRTGCAEGLAAAARDGAGAPPGHEHEHEHEPEHAGAGAGVASGWGWNPWGALQARLTPQEHLHLQGEQQEKELLPWIWAAIKVDPTTPQPYMVGAYWLVRRLGRPTEGMALLEDGIRQLPANAELEFCRGELLLQRQPADVAAAREAFARAVAKWRPLAAAGDPGARAENDQTWILAQLYLAALDRQAGRLEAAQAALREILRRYPDHPLAVEQLARLSPPPPAP